MFDPLLSMGSLSLGAHVIKHLCDISCDIVHKLLLQWCNCKAEACSSDTFWQFASGVESRKDDVQFLRLM